MWNKAKIIQLRWVDTNKGVSETPSVIARLIGKEFKTDDNPANFAATPPLEAVRFVISRAATIGCEHYGVMINDVARAYFNARIDRLLY